MFNLYFAGSRQGNDEHIVKRKANRLYSYANDQKHIEKFIAEPERGPLLVDSGAFSVAHSNITVNIDDYIAYINNHPEIENFIELDVIPYPVLNHQTAIATAEASWENYLYMIERLDEPFKLLPVFHFGEDLKYLKRILEFTYKGQHIPFMCIGGRHGVSTAKQEKYFETIFKTVHSSSNPNIKIHVLGMTVLNALEKFPFYSADSTSHLQYAIYGMIMTNLGAINVSDGNFKKGNFKYLTKEEQDIVLKLVTDLGYEMEKLQTDYLSRICFNIDYTYYWSQNYEYKGPKSFKGLNKLF